ncbi:hypothetical protein J5N97_003624 [Dioscorea zingiberensis]|uniref:Uncharacterized protein n=1 Tax=Dioscorea zingiberensis TaxID=325984 RepID=A0A9D5D6Y5_9LILI|nr:hypothetical protein J5N97_003624 [Dioscorea zingiberensis]
MSKVIPIADEALELILITNKTSRIDSITCIFSPCPMILERKPQASAAIAASIGSAADPGITRALDASRQVGGSSSGSPEEQGLASSLPTGHRTWPALSKEVAGVGLWAADWLSAH